MKQLGEFCKHHSQGSVIGYGFLYGKTQICPSPFCKLPSFPLLLDHLFHLFEFKTARSVSKALQDRTVCSSQELCWELTLPVSPAASSVSGEGLAALQSKSLLTNPQDLAEISFSAVPVPVFPVLLLVFTSRAAAPTQEHQSRLCAMLCQPGSWAGLSELPGIFLDKAMCPQGVLGFPWEGFFSMEDCL